MTLIMPMAGKGSRFSNWELPKPYIRILDKPLFFWAYSSLANHYTFNRVIFIILEEHNLIHEAVKIISSHVVNPEIFSLQKVENGPARTLSKFIKKIPENEIIYITDCDQAFFEKNFIKTLNSQFKDNSVEAVISSIESTNHQHGFIQLDKHGNVLNCVEKRPVSSIAFGGVYAFKNKKVLEETLNELLSKTNPTSEIFLSDLIHLIIDSKKIVRNIRIQEHVSLGTPEEFNKNKTSNIFRKLLNK
jgi:bifunctional N-acetylglucosamine-1-phosphate-uridyltransferase/glucosamine-1-phosphate-acetyltransferase GlmU-like protein